MVYSSPANRALTTCNIFIKNLKITKNLLKIDNNLYDFGGQSVTNFIKNLDHEENHINDDCIVFCRAGKLSGK